METGEVKYEKVFASPRPPPKISLEHDWMKELGSEVARQPEGEVVRQSKTSQSSQPNPNPDHDRTVTPVVSRDASHAEAARKTSRSQEIETRAFHEEAVQHERTGTPVVCRDASHAQGPVLRRSKHVRFVKKLRNMTERENPLFALKQRRPKHVSLVTARTSFCKKRKITIER